MQKSLFPGYTIGVDAYDDIKNVCPAYVKKVAVIGGKHALAAAKEGILKRAAAAGIEVIGVMSARFLPEMNCFHAWSITKQVRRSMWLSRQHRAENM